MPLIDLTTAKQIIQTQTQYSMPLTVLTTVEQIIQTQTQYSMPLRFDNS